MPADNPILGGATNTLGPTSSSLFSEGRSRDRMVMLGRL